MAQSKSALRWPTAIVFLWRSARELGYGGDEFEGLVLERPPTRPRK